MEFHHQMISIGISNPLALLISIPILVAILIVYRRSRSQLAKVSERLGIAKRSRIVKVLTLVKICTAAVLAVALTQPYIVVYERIPIDLDNVLNINTSTVEILVLLDVSKSMGYVDGGIKRMDIALDLVEKLLKMIKRDRVTIAIFARDTEILCRDASAKCIDRLRSMELKRYSAIGNAIAFAISYSKATSLPVAAILVTDGANNYGIPIEDAIRNANSSSIALIPIIVGSDPRAHRFLSVCREVGVKVYRVSGHVSDALLRDIAEDIYREAKYTALKIHGELYGYRVSYDYTLTRILVALAIALFIASVIEGV